MEILVVARPQITSTNCYTVSCKLTVRTFVQYTFTSYKYTQFPCHYPAASAQCTDYRGLINKKARFGPYGPWAWIFRPGPARGRPGQLPSPLGTVAPDAKYFELGHRATFAYTTKVAERLPFDFNSNDFVVFGLGAVLAVPRRHLAPWLGG